MGAAVTQDAKNGCKRLPPQERAIRQVLWARQRRDGYAKEEERLASQNASKALSQRRHVEANRAHRSEGQCERHLEANNSRDGEEPYELDSESSEFNVAGVGQDMMVERAERRVALVIANFISDKLFSCPGPSSKKVVLGRVLDHKKVLGFLPNHILPSKVAAIYMDVVGGVSARLNLVKRGNSASKLATKYAILDASVSARTRHSSTRQVARVLGVHHRNVSVAIYRREVINSNGDFVCMLAVRSKRTDGLSNEERAIIIQWWVVETRVSPNKKDVTRKWLSPGVYDTKPTHYL